MRWHLQRLALEQQKLFHCRIELKAALWIQPRMDMFGLLRTEMQAFALPKMALPDQNPQIQLAAELGLVNYKRVELAAMVVSDS